MPWINPDAFDENNPELKEKVLLNLEERGVTIMHECKVIDIITVPATADAKNQDPQLNKILLKRLDIPDEEEEEDEFE